MAADDGGISRVKAQLTDVEATAVQVARWRAQASKLLPRPDGSPRYDGSFDQLIVDTCLSPEEQAAPDGKAAVMVGVVGIRTAEVDEHLMQAVARGSAAAAAAADGGGGGSAGEGLRQLVLVGAGLDARAWRLPLAPSAGSGSPFRVYELDSGSTEALKARILGPPGPGVERVFVQSDLGRPDEAMAALASAGHDPARPSAWVAEGLIGYLSAEAGNALLRLLRSASPPGSLLLVTTPPSPAWRDSLAAGGTRLFHSTFEEDTDTLARVRDNGWTDAVLLTAADLSSKYGMTTHQSIVLARC
ncbi:hypothetical protein HYH03_007694 [Edaphochlamys debaryana]|uniref:S-adenosyl-L-methionine-dependent methyltransferase n=1 Tax=Edaphochlamys debaryana TaxID=47281 RepID=A0A836BYX3_9CHLO|nr:hypothetical protein HYH03_007694 [Edaphochlamys debaryana]|eukprot:KAG2494050.1 hypothetical protein HYH03_007694 [Edaphochlamys debaryana]